MKYATIATNPIGTAKRAYCKLEIFKFAAAMIFGIFPGINIPPLTVSPSKIALIVDSVICGLISAAAKVALSNIADTMLIQYKINGSKWSKNRSINGWNPAPKKVNAITNK